MDVISPSFLATSRRILSPNPPPPSPTTRPTISAVRTEEKHHIQTTPKPNTSTGARPKPTDKSITTRRPLSSNHPASRIKRSPTPSLPATLCNALDEFINNFIDPPVLRPSVDPRNVLSNNFAPVGELPPTPCPVVRGRVPPCLGGGAYIRNGPNPQYLPRGPHHLFDGDGMLHSLLLPRGGGTAPATLCSRFVHTYRYLLEREAGAPVLPSIFSGFYGAGGVARGAVAAARVLTAQMNPAEGVGLANTSLAFFAGRLYALGESDLPYVMHVSPEDGELSTVGRCDFEGRLSMGMTAHPKKDPVTGELFAFRYGPLPPFVSYFRFDRQGRKSADVPIFSVREPSMLHDFAITKRHAVFPDIQIVMKPMDMLVGGGAPVGSDRGKVPRLGVLPRYAASEGEMRWFEVPGFNPVHIVNAWEEGDDHTDNYSTTTSGAGRVGPSQLVVVGPNVLSVEHALDRMELVHSCVEMVRIDLGSGTVSRTPLSASNLDFGVIHPGYVGRRNRYAYMGVGGPMPKIFGVVKLDFALAGRGDCEVARREFGPGCFGGEPFFVPAAPPDGSGKGEEDEGYVVSYVHDEGRGESSFVVMDARSPDLDIVAEVLLPRRVPYGFHGLFVSESELRSQSPRQSA